MTFSARTMLLGAAVLGLVGGVSAGCAVGSTGSESSCPSRLALHGVEYGGHGEVKRFPRLGPSLGEATLPSCDDGDGEEPDGSIEVFEIPGVDSADAVFGNGGVWLSDGTSPQGPGLAPLFQKVSCDVPGEEIVTGQVWGVEGPPVQADYELETPYVATVLAEDGDSLPLQKYSEVMIEVRVDEDTRGGTDKAITRIMFAQPVQMTVHCNGKSFVASHLRLMS